MKLSELRVCDSCGGALLSKGSIQFYRIEVDSALLKPVQVNQVLGMAQYFQGSMVLAEMFSSEEPVAFLSDHGAEKTELLFCMDCYVKDISLASICEMVNIRASEAKE